MIQQETGERIQIYQETSSQNFSLKMTELSIVFVGDSRCGKTQLINRFHNGKFSKVSFVSRTAEASICRLETSPFTVTSICNRNRKFSRLYKNNSKIQS